jgi:hypothetical protein
LVANGGYSDFSKSIEVVNLDSSNPNLVCNNLPDFPVGAAGTIGQLFQGTTPVICGGARPDRWVVLCDCYALKDGGWAKIAKLSHCHRFASSALVTLDNKEEVMLVTGGNNGFTLPYVEGFNGTGWNEERFSDMMQPVWEHCTVNINSTTLLSIGGTIDGTVYDAIPNTYFYNVQDNQWTKGPTLNTARAGSSCGVLNWNNPETNQMEKVVVVAGGYFSNSVELLFLDGNKNSGSWVSGPSLPKSAWLSTMIEFQNSVILVGGKEGGSGDGVDGQHLYQLTSPNGTWVEMEQTLKKTMSAHVSFLVPDELVSCH